MPQIKPKRKCLCCGKEHIDGNFYSTHSRFFDGTDKLPFCKNCIKNLYQYYYEKYLEDGSLTPEKDAIKRLCMIFDLYFSEEAFQTVKKKMKQSENVSPIATYMQNIQLSQYKDKSYDTTITEENNKEFKIDLTDEEAENTKIDKNVRDFFGNGFSDDDYIYLKREYDDWVARHECKTKAQEEVFKRLCFKQLEILKASRNGEDTSKLDATFQNLLDTAKLQPKQNSGDAMSDAQTFGTLIDKWENTRPIPEVDKELKDVDKIGYLIHVFYTGHIAKVLNLPSTLYNIYDKYIQKWTVKKREYSGESDNEVLFDNIFGKKNVDELDT